MGQYIGQSVKRVEDQRFITGKGQYTDDITLPGMTFATIIRSPLAHANIKNIDLSAAKMHRVMWQVLWAAIFRKQLPEFRAVGKSISKTATR